MERAEVREWIVFYIDTGSGLGPLIRALRDWDGSQHPSIPEERTRAEVQAMRSEGLIKGDDSWIKVTERGWAWWKTRPGVGVD